MSASRPDPTDADREKARRYWLDARYADDADPEDVIAQVIADTRAAERETALAPVLAHAAAKLRDEVTREIAAWMAAPHEPEQWQIDNAGDLAANLLTGPLAALVAERDQYRRLRGQR